MFLDAPVFGCGFSWRDAMLEPMYAKFGVGPGQPMMNAHNMFLQMLADSGVLGFAGFLAMLASVWESLKRAHYKLVGMAFLMGLILTGLFQNHLRDSEFLYACWVFLALLIAQTMKGELFHAASDSAASVR
jgi:O-antigen ligase